VSDVLENVEVPEFLSELGVSTAGVSGHNLLFNCPFHHDTHPSARMSLRDTRWVCSSGCGGGNAITFLARIKNIPNNEAWDIIKRRWGNGLVEAMGGLEEAVSRNLAPVVEVSNPHVRPAEEWAAFLAENLWRSEAAEPLAYMTKTRGFTEEALHKWEIGYDFMSQRITIPVRDVDAQLVGFKARSWQDGHEPRYLPLGDMPRREPRYGFTPYPKSDFVFGLYRVPKGSPIVIVEGELNVVAIDQKCPKYHAAGLAGVEFSSRQRRLIVEHCSEAILYLDDNRAGRRGTEKVSKLLSPYMGVWVVVGAPGDAAELMAPQIEAEIMDAHPSLFHAVNQG
jgi:DNA primase